MESKQKQYPVVDVTGYGSEVWCCKEQNCIGTWTVRSMNPGKLEARGFSRAAAPVWGFSRGTMGSSGSLSCGAGHWGLEDTGLGLGHFVLSNQLSKPERRKWCCDGVAPVSSLEGSSPVTAGAEECVILSIKGNLMKATVMRETFFCHSC